MLRSLFLCVPLLLLANVASALALPPCPGPNILAWHSCEGTYTLDNGDRYIGEWRDSLPNGQGPRPRSTGRGTLVNGETVYLMGRALTQRPTGRNMLGGLEMENMTAKALCSGMTEVFG